MATTCNKVTRYQRELIAKTLDDLCGFLDDVIDEDPNNADVVDFQRQCRCWSDKFKVIK